MVHVEPVFRRIISLPAVLLFSRVLVRAQPAFYVEIAARELIDIMKFGDRLLPIVMKSMIPAIVQKRADVEHDYDAQARVLQDGFAAHISELCRRGRTKAKDRRIAQQGPCAMRRMRSRG